MSGHKRYSLRRSLRDTLYGKVFLGLDNHTNQPIIIKQCGLWHVKHKVSTQGYPVKEDVYEEIRVHQELSADENLPVFVLKLLDVVQDDQNLFIILEFARGGELFSYVQSRGRPDAKQEKRRIAILRQQHKLDLYRRQQQQQQQQQAVADAGSNSALARQSSSTSASMNDDGGDEAKSFEPTPAATSSSSTSSSRRQAGLSTSSASSSRTNDVPSSSSSSSSHRAPATDGSAGATTSSSSSASAQPSSSSLSSSAAAARRLLSPTTSDGDENKTSSIDLSAASAAAPKLDLRHPHEIEACRFMRQLLEGMRYIHDHAICHRDLSLENLLLDDHHNVKIIDFGVACGGAGSPAASGDWTTPAGRVGKVGYMAPEVWDGLTYDGRLADVWSMGVIFFVLLVGCPPYEMPHDRDPRFQLIVSGRVSELLNHWDLLEIFTPDAIDLLTRMLLPEAQRITVDQMLAHPFFANQSAAPLT